MADAEQDSTYDFAPNDKPPPKPAAKKVPGPEENPQAATTGGSPRMKPAAVKSAAPADAAAGNTAETQTRRRCPYCEFTYVGRVKARCPQCAAAIDGPMDLFQFSEPAWVRRLAAGMTFIALAVPMHVFGAILKLAFWDTPGLKGVAHALAALLLWKGVSMVTQSPAMASQPLSKAGRWSRRLAMAAAVLWVILGIIAFKAMPHALVKTLVITTLLEQIALGLALGYFCAGLAARVPNDSLTNQSHYCAGMVGIGSGALLIVQFAEVYTQDHLWFFPCSFPLIFGLFAMFGWTTLTLLRLAGDLRACATAGDSIIAKRMQRQAAVRK